MVSYRHLNNPWHHKHFISGTTQALLEAIFAIPSLARDSTHQHFLSFNMLPMPLLLIVVALAAFCDAYAYAPAHVGGIATNNLPLLPQRDLFTRNDTNSSRTPGVYKLSDLYDYTNFFDKFSFVEVSALNCPSPRESATVLTRAQSRTGTDQYTDVDPTHGFVLYQNRSEAERMGLVQMVGDVAAIMVDYTTVIKDPLGYGRKSVRIESTATYNHGLVITDFSHLPKAQCGTWPA